MYGIPPALLWLSRPGPSALQCYKAVGRLLSALLLYLAFLFLFNYFHSHWRLQDRSCRYLPGIFFWFLRFSMSKISPSHGNTSVCMQLTEISIFSLAKRSYSVKLVESSCNAEWAASASAAFLPLPDPLPKTVFSTFTSTVKLLSWFGPVAFIK